MEVFMLCVFDVCIGKAPYVPMPTERESTFFSFSLLAVCLVRKLVPAQTIDNANPWKCILFEQRVSRASSFLRKSISCSTLFPLTMALIRASSECVKRFSVCVRTNNICFVFFCVATWTENKFPCRWSFNLSHSVTRHVWSRHFDLHIHLHSNSMLNTHTHTPHSTHDFLLAYPIPSICGVENLLSAKHLITIIIIRFGRQIWNEGFSHFVCFPQNHRQFDLFIFCSWKLFLWLASFDSCFDFCSFEIHAAYCCNLKYYTTLSCLWKTETDRPIDRQTTILSIQNTVHYRVHDTRHTHAHTDTIHLMDVCYVSKSCQYILAYGSSTTLCTTRKMPGCHVWIDCIVLFNNLQFETRSRKTYNNQIHLINWREKKVFSIFSFWRNIESVISIYGGAHSRSDILRNNEKKNEERIAWNKCDWLGDV